MKNLLTESESLPVDSYTDKEIRNAINSVPSLWAATLKNEQGLQLSFEKRKFLIDIYNDLSPKQVLLKPPQIGATVMNTLKSLWIAQNLHKDIIYTLPTATDVIDIVGGSVNRIIAQNETLREWVSDHDTVEQKSVGGNLIRYRGTFSPKQATMVPSSLNIHDEVDSSDQKVLTLYETRLEAQEDESKKWRWYFSHPSLAGSGIDIYWQLSDKKEWVITCPSCKQKQVLTWPKSVSREKQAYVCKQCDEVLPDKARIYGFWHPTAQGEFSGYHVSQLMLYNKSAKDILDAFDDPNKDKQYFYNYVLGLPYVGGDDQITAEQVLSNCTAETNSQDGRIIIGVDTGLPIHYCMMNKEGVFYYNTCKPSFNGSDPYDDLRNLLKRFTKAIIISDQGGDLIGIRKLQQEFPGRVFLAFYRKPQKKDTVIEWGEGKSYGTVVIDRNRHIQLMVEQLKEIGRIRLNGVRTDWTEFADHFANMYREKIVVRDAKDKDDRTLYGAEYVWKRRGPDHYAHCLAYALAGFEKYGGGLATTTAPDIFDTLKIGVSDDKFTGEVILRAIEDNRFSI